MILSWACPFKYGNHETKLGDKKVGYISRLQIWDLSNDMKSVHPWWHLDSFDVRTLAVITVSVLSGLAVWYVHYGPS